LVIAKRMDHAPVCECLVDPKVVLGHPGGPSAPRLARAPRAEYREGRVEPAWRTPSRIVAIAGKSLPQSPGSSRQGPHDIRLPDDLRLIRSGPAHPGPAGRRSLLRQAGRPTEPPAVAGAGSEPPGPGGPDRGLLPGITLQILHHHRLQFLYFLPASRAVVVSGGTIFTCLPGGNC
jgi:hypothetical protein